MRRRTALPPKALRPRKKVRGDLVGIVGAAQKGRPGLRSLRIPRHQVPILTAVVGRQDELELAGMAEIFVYGREIRARIKTLPKMYVDGMSPHLWVLPDNEEVTSGELVGLYLSWDKPYYRRIKVIKQHHEIKRSPHLKENHHGLRKWNYPKKWYGKKHVHAERLAFGLTRKSQRFDN